MLNKLLSAYGVDVWISGLDADAGLLEFYGGLLSAAERGKAERFATSALRSRYIETRGRLRRLLAEYCNCAPQALRFGAEAYGKPYLPDYPEIAFNLSHSQHLMAVAAGYRCRIGVDIEVRRERLNLAPLVRRCFAASERDYWERLPPEQQLAAFYALWTQKEAFVKAAGRGVALGLERCVAATQGDKRFLAVPDGYGVAGDWRVVGLDLGEAAYGALVIGG